jgi:ubiquitin-like protein Nedd8
MIGPDIEIEIEPDFTVSKIKELAEEKNNIPHSQQKLLFGNKLLSDDKTAREYNLEEGATLRLILRLRA